MRSKSETRRRDDETRRERMNKATQRRAESIGRRTFDDILVANVWIKKTAWLQIKKKTDDS